jgi:hypothetical protein
LAKSVVYSRQGNPEWAGQERDGRDGIRAVDAYVGWIDLERLKSHRLMNRCAFEPDDHRNADGSFTAAAPGIFSGWEAGVLIATGDSHRIRLKA